MDKQRQALTEAYESQRHETAEYLMTVWTALRDQSSNHVASSAGEWSGRLDELLTNLGDAAEAIRRLDFFDRPR